MKFSKQFLLDEVIDGDLGIRTTIEDQGRWITYKETIFGFEGKHYLLSWSHGSTEYQDSPPLEDDPDKISCVEMVQRPVMTWVINTSEV